MLIKNMVFNFSTWQILTHCGREDRPTYDSTCSGLDVTVVYGISLIVSCFILPGGFVNEPKQVNLCTEDRKNYNSDGCF